MAGTRKARRTWRSKARASPEIRAVARRLGRRIRRIREAQRLTQEEAASRAEIDSKHWQVLEAGGTNPTLSTMLAVVHGLDSRLRDLFADT